MRGYPNVSEALRGWTRKRWVQIVTQTIVNGLADRTVENVRKPIMIQPMPPREVQRQREDQRDWGWWSIWAKGLSLKVDDVIVVEGKPYLVSKIHDWGQGGYHQYEAHENWTGELPPPPSAITYDGATVTYNGEQLYA